MCWILPPDASSPTLHLWRMAQSLCSILIHRLTNCSVKSVDLCTCQEKLVSGKWTTCHTMYVTWIDTHDLISDPTCECLQEHSTKKAIKRYVLKGWYLLWASFCHVMKCPNGCESGSCKVQVAGQGWLCRLIITVSPLHVFWGTPPVGIQLYFDIGTYLYY